MVLPNFSIKEREVQGVVILDLSGRLLAGEECCELRKKVVELLAEGRNKLIINLEQVSFVDSMGLGCLASCYVSAANRGGILKLLRPSDRIRKLLAWTGVLRVIETHNDEPSALESLVVYKRLHSAS